MPIKPIMPIMPIKPIMPIMPIHRVLWTFNLGVRGAPATETRIFSPWTAVRDGYIFSQ